jgi:hypothetical protein
MKRAAITCPACGWAARSPGAHAHAFRYIEEVTSIRWVMGVDASGTLRIDASDRIADEEGGRSPRLQCGECFAEFPLPTGTKVEFVC